MKKGKLSYKVLSSFLALLMIFTTLPIANSSAAANDESKNLGTVSAITDKKAKVETNGTATTVLFDNEIELEWAPANDEIKRGKDGWWVGVKLTAPKFDDDSFYNILSETKYQSKAYGSDEWQTVNGKSFWDNQDSDKTNAEENIERYITLWAFVNEANLEKAKNANENIKTEWRFDWICENSDADAEFDDAQTEQTITVEIDPSKVTLNKNGKQVYPIVLKDASAITDKIEPTTAEVNGVSTTTFLFDNSLTLNWVKNGEGGVERGKDGWWVGVKLNAPDLGEELLSYSTYQSQAYGGNLVEDKSFWGARDSKNDNKNGEYITLWAFVNEENLNNAKAKKETIETLWNFDWNNDSNIDQTVIVQIKPDAVTLNKNGEQVYPAAGLGSVEGITGSVNIADDKSNSVTASYSDKVTLQWSKANKDIGRNADGWWAGIKMTAPTTKVDEVENVKYQSKAYGSDEWLTVNGKSFWGNQDSDQNNRNDGVERYITLWAYVQNQGMLDAASEDGKEIITQWRFDWNGDGVYEQYVNFELDPDKIELDYTELYKLDTEKPAITVNNSAQDKEKVQWSADSATISGTVEDIQADDYASGIKEVYCLNSKSEKVDEFKYENGQFSFTVTEEGESEYTIVAIDNSGRESTQNVYAKVDKTDPEITDIKIKNASAELKAVKSDEPQTVEIEAKDEQSGIASIIVDGKDVTENSAFEVTENGTYTVKVINGVGKESEKDIIIDNFDNAAPSASLNLPDTGEATWIKEVKDFFRKLFKLKENETSIDSTVTLAVQDEKSVGENDKYSKITEAYYYIVNIDAVSADLENEISKITSEAVKKSGISMITDGMLQSPKIKLNVGESAVFVYAKDEAGNELFDYSNGFVFEETKPQITVVNGETVITDNDDLKMNAAPNFVISVQDAASKDGGFVSGIQEVTMSVNGEDASTLTKVADSENVADGKKGSISFNQESFKDILDLSKPGEYEITITARDMCNNVSTLTFAYRFDDIKPQFSDLTYNKLKGEFDWSKSDSVTFSVTDSYTDKNGDKVDVSADIAEVEYAIVESDDADLTDENLIWNKVTKQNGLFALNTDDVKDGNYEIFVAVRYTDDCGNEIETPIRKVDIKKDSVTPAFDHFALSVEKNNVVQNIINVLSHGVYCNESVNIRAYAEDATSGLNKTATLIYNRELAESDQTIVEDSKTENSYEMELSDEGYYECPLPLTGDNYNFVYTDISVVISDNYCVNDENGKKLYSQTVTKKLDTDNTVVISLNEENEIIKTKIENSLIQLENIAPVISDAVVNDDVISCKIDDENIVYNDALISTIGVTDANSGISQVTVNVAVNDEETKCDFDVYKDNKNSKIGDVSFVYNAKEGTVTEYVGEKPIGDSIKVTELTVSDKNKIKLTVNAIDNAGNSAKEKVYSYTIDNKSPEVTVLCENKKEYTNENVTYTFDLNGEEHFKNGENLGKTELVYTYNEAKQDKDKSISSSYENDSLTKVLSADGKYTMNSIKVVDLLGNETIVNGEDFGVRTEFIIDKIVPTVPSVVFNTENNSKIINFFKFGIFANDVVTVTATIENTNALPEDTAKADVQGLTAPLKDAVLSLGEKTKEVKDFAYNSETNCWTAEFKIALDTENTTNITVTDAAENTAVYAVDVDDDSKLTVSESDVNSGIKYKSEDDKPQINLPQTAEDIAEKAATIKTNENVVINNYSEDNEIEKIWFNKDFVLPITVNDTGNSSENAPVSGVKSVTITVNDEDYISEYNYDTQEEYDEDFDAEHKYEINLTNYELSADNNYIIKVSATDFAGNTSEESVTIYKDTNAPTVEESNKSSDKNIEIDGVTYYSKDFKSEYTVTDNETGIHQVMFDITAKNDSEEITKTVVFDVKGKNISTLTYEYDPVAGAITQTGDEGSDVVKQSSPKLKSTSDDCVYTVKVTAVDNAENSQDEIDKNASVVYHIDNKSPVVAISNEGVKDYTNANVSYKFTTDEVHIDNTAENTKVEYVYNESKTVSTRNIGETYADGSYSIRFDKDAEKDGKYEINKVTVIDLLGNTTELTAKSGKICGNDSRKSECQNYFTIDTFNPTVSSVEFKTVENNKFIHFFRFGIFANKVLEAKVIIENDTEDSNVFKYTSPLNDNKTKLLLGDKENLWKLVSITPVYVDGKNETSGIKQWQAVYSIDVNNIGSLNFKTADVAENAYETPFKYKSDESGESIDITFTDGKNKQDVETNFFLSENAAPVISFEKDKNGNKEIFVSPNEIEKTEYSLVRYKDANGFSWFNKNVIIPITVNDSDNGGLKSGIWKVKISVNDKIYNDGNIYDFDYSAEYKKDETYSYEIDTSKCEIKPDGSYEIVVVATDFAGNEKTEKLTVFKDIETPYVDFAFKGIGNQDSLKNNEVELVELKKSVYGYYFVKDTKVTVTATDENCDHLTSGVKSITYYAVDVNVKENNGIVISGKDVAVDKNNQVTFTVPANFKGQIYAYATDKLGNNYSSALVCNEEKLTANPTGDGSKCVIPDKTIVENAAKHSEETHISYEVITKTNTKDASGFDLYNKAVDVKVTITDTYSGIRSGSITVTSDENSTDVNNESFEILNNKTFKEGKGWTVEKTDGNLVTQISKVIRITRNSNNILVSASMTDRAGNETNNVKLRKFSIDTVAPEITVRYSNNSASDGKYFKANRTATITVTERNFDPSLVTAQINGKAVSLNWSGIYSNNANREGTTYTATITYGSDGDYKFGISCKDRAGNADNSPKKYAGQTAPTDFVIDKTAPVVTVSNTSTAEPQNGNYYSKPVQVTITVVEHNWDPAKFSIAYTENDSNVNRVLSWSNSGDTHTATFTCDSSTGLKYTIDYALADRAANNAVFIQNGLRVNDYRPDEFYVDQTIPEISFTGALDGSHNNGAIESGIVLSDTYYDRVEVTLTGKRRGAVLQQTYTETNINITEFVEMSRNNDDYYTVSVVAYDKAGNRNVNPATRSYSINRKGSMFVLSADAKKLNEGANSKNVVNSNVVIYEYNVDRTVSEQVELWKNGNVTKLTRGQGYTVSVTENQNGYFCNTYSIASNLFADDAAYRVYITTKDEAGNTSTNTSKNSAALSTLDKNNGEAPVLSFIKDTTPPAIDINLDITKMDSYYSIKQNEYVITFTVTDSGSGLGAEAILVTYSEGNKTTELTPVPVEGQEGTYTITLSGSYDELTFTVKDNAGNEDSTLEFKRVTVSANPFVRLVANTPLFVGLIVAFVAIAIIIIILIAKRKKDDDEEENEEAKEKKKNK